MKQTTRRPLVRWLGTAVVLFCALIAAQEGAARDGAAPAVLTLDEAARLLRISAEELGGLAARRAVPARRIGQSWRFNRAALMAWLNGDWRLITGAVPQRPPVGRVSHQPVAQPLAPREMAAVAGAGTARAQNPAASESPDRPVGAPP